ncbi:hypothetical protein [Acetobacter peroxydans]|uniref:Uncharacterized protein n=1 Tax=Acetobacter peroxydans TaxID=104098 RepID=A0A4Y3TSE6_9PROT|nr:hypothetical protein [Acetobacter peroxydans]NHO15878.1 hypothetical protein [Acetobacter peroxydans]GBR33349.1 hypothetical protein AA13755_0500 [Acetobacter peroxydans NBRC 13755]GBR44138.1 hypothetical protein AA0475_2065 [Acetobacter peroxydans]GEB84712.1 hypothetical protein APE01nite_05090 [Acetobacter peroxydans]
MSDTTETTQSADPQEWKVRIMDLSGPAEDNTVEEVGVFHDLAHANAFARAYVRDSIERCRVPGAAARDVLEAWLSFGEDAEVIDADEDGWRSANELDDFTATPATPMERDWRAIDPRRLVVDDDVLSLLGTDDDEDALPDDDDDTDLPLTPDWH